MRLNRTAPSSVAMPAYPVSQAIGGKKRHNACKQMNKNPADRSSSWIVFGMLFSAGVGLYILSLFWPMIDVSIPWFAVLFDIVGIALILVSLRIIWKKPRTFRTRN